MHPRFRCRNQARRNQMRNHQLAPPGRFSERTSPLNRRHFAVLLGAVTTCLVLPPAHAEPQGNSGNHGHGDDGDDQGHGNGKGRGKGHDRDDNGHGNGNGNEQVIVTLPPVPYGYQRGYYDGYAVVVDPRTRIIVDAVDIVSALSGR